MPTYSENRFEEYKTELSKLVTDPNHQRLIEAYKLPHPIENMENVLGEILMEVLQADEDKNLALQGFRGFNRYERSPIDFHESLTLIFGPNSYGKTSISEAFEWILYGVTSKVQGAEAINNKTEYQGSYRNCHFDGNGIPFVEVTFYREDNSEVTCRGELQRENDSITKFVDGSGVVDWPWASEALSDPRPFVLQHSLRSLLF